MEQKTQTAGETAPRAKSQWLQDLNETLSAFQETMDAEKDTRKGIFILAADAHTGEAIIMTAGGRQTRAALVADFLTSKKTAPMIADAAHFIALQELKKQNGGALVIDIDASQDDDEPQEEPTADGAE